MRQVIVLVLLAGCGGPKQPKFARQSQGVLVSTQEDGTIAFVRRMDGNVEEIFRAEVTGTEAEFVVLTGPSAGRDQCKVLLLSQDGRVKGDYRLPGTTPWQDSDKSRGEYLRVRVYPGQVIPFQRNEHRYLLVVATGNFAPVSVTVLEWTGDQFVERFVFWSFGHIHQVVIMEPYIALFGVTSSFEGETNDYTPALVVFRLDDILIGGTEPIRDKSPTRSTPQGEVSDANYLWYMRMPDQRNLVSTFWSPRIEGDQLIAPTIEGLKYVIDLVSGVVELVPGDLYRREYDLRQDRGELPDLTTHLAYLSRQVLVWHKAG